MLGKQLAIFLPDISTQGFDEHPQVVVLIVEAMNSVDNNASDVCKELNITL